MNKHQEIGIDQCIYSRRTVRKYDDVPVPNQLVDELIHAAIYAPSACNHQAWKFVVIHDEQIKKDLVSLGCSPIITQAPKGIMVTYRNDIEVGGKKHGDYIQSGSAAIQNMLLKAHALGLGACWICQLPKTKVLRPILHIPKNYDIIAYVAIGYPHPTIQNTQEQIAYNFQNEGGYQKHKRKYSVDQVRSFNQFQVKENDSTYVNMPKKSIWHRIKNFF